MARKRPAIPWRVVAIVAARQAEFTPDLGYHICCAETGEFIGPDQIDQLERDHNPPLILREYDEKTGLYTPDANDPNHIDLVSIEGHKRRTNQRRGLNRGDQTEHAHRRSIRAKEAAHKDAMANKRPGKGRKPRGQIKSRGFDRTLKKTFKGTVEKRPK